MIIKYISLILSSVFETYYANMFFGIFMKPKFDKKKHFIFLCALFVIQAINSILNIQEILLFVAIIFTIGVALIFDGKILLKIGLASLLTVINALAELLTSALVMLFLDNKLDDIYNNISAYLIVMIISKFTVFSIILMAKIIFTKKNNLFLSTKDILLVVFLPIATMVTMFMMCHTLVNIDDPIMNILYVVSAILLIFSNVVIFEVIKHQSELVKSKMELSYTQKSLEEQKKHYQSIMNSQEEIRRIRHDEKNMYTAALAALESGETAALKKIISTSLNIIDKNNVLNTNHPAIDAVIQSKLDVCEELKIETNFKYFYKEPINIDDIEISIIIGNLLDNAIEACEFVNENKWINFLITAEYDEINISVSNSCNVPEIKNLETNKKNKIAHGFGIKNIKNITEKYNGESSFEYQNGSFISFVSLKNITIE